MSRFLPGLLDPLLIPLFFFSFFFLPCCEGIFLAFLGVWSLLLMYSQFSLRIVPFVDVFLMYSWGETNSASYNSTILTSPAPPPKVCCLLLSWTLRKPNFLNFFLTISSPCFSVPSFWSFLFVWLSGWVCVCVCFCFVRLFFIEGQRNRGQSLVKSWFPGLIFLSPLSSYLHLFVLFSFLDDSPQPFCHNSFSWNFNLCYHVFNLKEFLCKCSLFSEYSFLIASWSCFMYLVSTIISELIIYGFLSFVFLKASFLWVAFSICFSLCKRRPVP